MIRSEKEMEGTPIHATDGAIGKVGDMYFVDRDWVVRYVVVDTGTWLESREVLIGAAQLRPAGPEAEGLHVGVTKAQVRDSPPADLKRPVSRQHERRLHDYFGWPYYWSASLGGMPLVMPPMPPTIPSPPIGSESPQAEGGPATSTAEVPDRAADPHLRGVREIRGSPLATSDGALGHIDDLLLDDTTWEIRFLVVDTRNWWPGKKVLLAPRWITLEEGPERVAKVPFHRDAIKGAPEYEAGHPPSEPYLAALDAYYLHLPLSL